MDSRAGGPIGPASAMSSVAMTMEMLVAMNPALRGLPATHPLIQQAMAQMQYAAVMSSQGSPFYVKSPPKAAGDAHDELGLAQEAVEETYSDEVFTAYQHTEVLPGCLPHPGDVVEAGSLAALSLPPVTYPLQDSLPPEIVTEGKLSSLQLAGIVHACQRHQLLLPSGQRAGYFLGDAAGVGKGRQVAGLVIDNFARGRTKHIWFSISSDLVVDARRDLSDLGCHLKVIEGCQQLDRETRVFGLPSDFKEGVIFSTYATLVSSVSRGGSLTSSKQSRLQQLVDWCGGENFEGCMVFDECHKAKHFVPGKEASSTKVALAVAHIQRLLPKARVVYCSATGVTDVKNMAFMERLGLWGDGAPFRSFEKFLETVQKKGLGVSEMLAMEMKSTGMYVSRGLSFKQAEFTTVEIEITKEQIKVFDTAAHVWNELRKALKSAVDRTNCSNNRIWSSFWSSHQRFFKQLCLGLKVPAILASAQQSLDDGYCVVIGLQTTGEASLEHVAGRSGSISEFVSLCREILTRFIEQHFPTRVETQGQQGLILEDEWSSTAKQMLLGFAGQISLPNSPLDEIIDKLGGPDAVAEMTGRRARIVRSPLDDKPHYQTRESNTQDVDSLNVQERNHFMAGRKHVAIISDAASTGISLHADKRAANQRRRIHITIELPWSADKAVQQLGRSHRSNQSSGPMFKLMTTNLGGERRFAAAVSRRLQSLGALTKGDRRAATGADLSEFNFDTPYGRAGLKAMYTSICQNDLLHGVNFSKLAGEKFETIEELNKELLESLEQMELTESNISTTGSKVHEKDTSDVSRFLNRILGLHVARQQLMFRYFCEALDLQILHAKKEGRYNEGLVDISAASVQLEREPVEVFKDVKKTSYPTMHTILVVDRGMSWEKAKTRLENNQGLDNGFYKSKRATWGKTLYILATLKEGSNHLFKIARPNTGVSNFEEDRSDLEAKYSKVEPEEAESEWIEQYKHAENHCIHGPKCKTGPTCTVGSRCYRVHLLCGAIMTLMSDLEVTIARYGPRLQLTKAESTLRVVRAQLDSGERVVGIRYPETLIPLVEKTLEEQSLLEKARKQLLDPKPGQIKPVMSATTTRVTSVEKEPVASVVPRYLKKAFTPPVTIRNFFKSQSKVDKLNEDKRQLDALSEKVKKEVQSKGNENDVCEVAKEEKSGGSFTNVEEDDKEEVVEDNGPVKKEDKIKPRNARTRSKKSLGNETKGSQEGSDDDWVMSDCDEGEEEKNKNKRSTRSSNRNSSIKKLQSKSMKNITKKSMLKSNGIIDGKENKDVKVNNKILSSDESEEEGPKPQPKPTAPTAKRLLAASPDVQNPTKRRKQGSIVSSMAVQKSKAEDVEKKRLICPICQIKFPPGTWNTEVNDHIDNCLID